MKMATVNPDRVLPSTVAMTLAQGGHCRTHIYNRNKKPTISSDNNKSFKKKWNETIGYKVAPISAAHGRVWLFWPHVYRIYSFLSFEQIKWHSPSPSAQVGPELWNDGRGLDWARVVKSGWRFQRLFCRQGRNAPRRKRSITTRQQQLLVGGPVHQPVGTTSATEINTVTGYFWPVQEEELRHCIHRIVKSAAKVFFSSSSCSFASLSSQLMANWFRHSATRIAQNSANSFSCSLLMLLP